MRAKPVILLIALLGLTIVARLTVAHRRAQREFPVERDVVKTATTAHNTSARLQNAPSTDDAPPQSARLEPALVLALQQLADEPDLVVQSERVQELAESLDMANLPATLNALARPEVVGPGVELRQLLVRRLTAADPGPTAAWAATVTDPSLRAELLAQIAAVWADSDPAQAAHWFKALPEDGARTAGLLTLGYQASRIEPLEALNLAVALPEGGERDQLLEHAVRQWAALDPHAAFAWATNIPHEFLRNRLVAASTIASAELSPVESATVSIVHLATPELQEQAVASIVQRWVQTDPASTAGWVGRFPESRLREICTGNMIEIWASMDPTAAAEWLVGLPDDAGRDTGLAAFARIAAPLDRSVALEWIDEIQERQCRERCLETVLRLGSPNKGSSF